MSSLTAKEIYDLNNSMVAAQNVALGTKLDALLTSSGSSGVKLVSGSFVPSGPVTPVNTGLSVVTGAVCSLGGTPKTTHHWSSVTTGSIGRYIWISCWSGSSPADGSIVVAASTGSAAAHFSQVNWIAQGT